jgi:hypothetical protein
MNQLDAGDLRIAEQAVVPIAEHQDIDTGRREVLAIV